MYKREQTQPATEEDSMLVISTDKEELEDDHELEELESFMDSFSPLRHTSVSPNNGDRYKRDSSVSYQDISPESYRSRSPVDTRSYRDRSPASRSYRDRSLTPYRDRSRSPSYRDRSPGSRSYRDRSRSRSRSPHQEKQRSRTRSRTPYRDRSRTRSRTPYRDRSRTRSRTPYHDRSYRDRSPVSSSNRLDQQRVPTTNSPGQPPVYQMLVEMPRNPVPNNNQFGKPTPPPPKISKPAKTTPTRGQPYPSIPAQKYKKTAPQFWRYVPDHKTIRKLTVDERTQILRDFPHRFRMSGITLSGLNMVPLDQNDIAPDVCHNCLKVGCRRETCPEPPSCHYCLNCGRRRVTVKNCIRCSNAYARSRMKGEASTDASAFTADTTVTAATPPIIPRYTDPAAAAAAAATAAATAAAAVAAAAGPPPPEADNPQKRKRLRRRNQRKAERLVAIAEAAAIEALAVESAACAAARTGTTVQPPNDLPNNVEQQPGESKDQTSTTTTTTTPAGSGSGTTATSTSQPESTIRYLSSADLLLKFTENLRRLDDRNRGRILRYAMDNKDMMPVLAKISEHIKDLDLELQARCLLQAADLDD